MQGAAGVFGSAILEVAIGIIFLYFVLSVICSSLVEFVSAVFQWRGKDLEKAMRDILGESDLFTAVTSHPLITAMGHNDGGSKQRPASAIGATNTKDKPSIPGRPAYISSRTFSLALLDTVANFKADPQGGAERIGTRVSTVKEKLTALTGADEARVALALRALIEDSHDPDRLAARMDSLKKVITGLPRQTTDAEKEQLRLLTIALAPLSALDDIQAVCSTYLPAGSPEHEAAQKYCEAVRKELDDVAYNIDKVQKNVEIWFDNAMDRMSGVYKRNVQKLLLVSALLVSIGIGADTMHFATALFANPTLRADLATAAQAQIPARAQQPTTLTDSASLLAPFSLLFGYSDIPNFEQNGTNPKLPIEQRSPFWFWLEKTFGIVATTFAIMMGAPFWFQLLQKVVNLRSTGPKPDTADEAQAKAAERQVIAAVRSS